MPDEPGTSLSFDLFNKFRRVTASNKYLPEVDGLRFLAVFSVVVVLHLTNFVNQKLAGSQLVPGGYVRKLIANGGIGIPLFFMISGFILALPFARWQLKNESRPSLYHYYLRRLLRLEPPYLIALLIFLIGHLFVIRAHGGADLMKHFMASAVYMHGFIYHSFSTILPVAWSLEVEVQFYILAPIFFTVFMIHSTILRRSIIGGIITLSAILSFEFPTYPNVFSFLHYFFAGILLADLFISGWQSPLSDRWGLVMGVASMVLYFLVWPGPTIVEYWLKLIVLIVLFYLVLTNRRMKSLFSIRWIALVGGMCYSIYLLHFGILATVNSFLARSGLVTRLHPLQACLLGLGYLLLILVVCSVFYYFVERPFMKLSRRAFRDN